MKFKVAVIVHFAGIVLVLLRLCFIPLEDHLRYGVGHLVCWLIVISSAFAFFYVPKTMGMRKWIKGYFGIYFLNACFMAIYPLTMVVLFAIAMSVPQGWRLMVAEDYFVQSLIPKPVECENSAYLVRAWNDVEYTDANKRFYLYRKEPFVERMITKRYAGDHEYETYHAKRILEVDEDKEILKIEVEVSSCAAHDAVRNEIQVWGIRMP